MIFNKAGKFLQQKFMLNENELECVNTYKHLGLMFSASGCFTCAQEELYNKALKAYFKLSKDFLSLNPNIQTSMHVFDHTIKPILLYGCEVWGTIDPFSAKFNKGIQNLTFDQVFTKQKAELLHQKFCKFLLGVNRKSTNFAVLSELGRFPLYFNVIKAQMKYHKRLQSINDTFPLLFAAYTESVNIDSSKYCSWYSSIKFIMDKTSTVLNTPYVCNNKFLVKYFTKEWEINRDKHSDGKLCSYITFKSNFGTEKYLAILKNFDLRKMFTRFRISAHRLAIETGRYKGIPRQDRLCTRCSANAVEDETHFLFECSGMNKERDILYSIINLHCKNFTLLPNDSKLIWIMNNENFDILKGVCSYIEHINQ